MSRASPLGDDANPLALRPATCSQSPVKGTAMGGLPCVPAARRSTPSSATYPVRVLDGHVQVLRV